MPKDYKMAVLFDMYGALLTKKQYSFIDLYYNDDLSLAEIAENEGITRQAVRDAIKHAEAQLADFEQKLGFCKKLRLIEGMAQSLPECEQREKILEITKQ